MARRPHAWSLFHPLWELAFAQKHQNGFQLDLALGAKEHLMLPLVVLKHLQLVVHWLAKKEQMKLKWGRLTSFGISEKSQPLFRPLNDLRFWI